MNRLVIEHLKDDELPHQWAEQLKATPDATFTVRIEAEQAPPMTHGAFGLWQDPAARTLEGRAVLGRDPCDTTLSSQIPRARAGQAQYWTSFTLTP